jgi:hypothetical protein
MPRRSTRLPPKEQKYGATWVRRSVNELELYPNAAHNQDGNTGLVTLVVQTLPEKKLLSLKKIYVKLSLADTADKVRVGEKMNDAEISSMVRFKVVPNVMITHLLTRRNR